MADFVRVALSGETRMHTALSRKSPCTGVAFFEALCGQTIAVKNLGQTCFVDEEPPGGFHLCEACEANKGETE